MSIWIFLGALGGVFAIVVKIYNGLARRRNEVRNAYSQIDVQLNRRYDLIPNLVETAKASMAHERQTLEAVIAARNVAYQANRKAAAHPESGKAIEEIMSAETALSASLGRFFALAENYPELKANQNMMQLSEELTSTENRVSFARQAYNDAVMHYNNSRETFPASLFADVFHFEAARFLELEPAEAKNPVRVKF